MSPLRHLGARTARAGGLIARRELSGDVQAAASGRIAATLESLPGIADARLVAGYWPMADEVDLVGLWERLDARGVAVHLPRIDASGEPAMDFVRWHPDATMTVNRFGIPEPPGEPIPLGTMDVIVIPCTAVDHAGTRVGMGAGFYDRALATAQPKPLLVAVAFAVQLLAPDERIRRRIWDVPVDVIVTESATITP